MFISARNTLISMNTYTYNIPKQTRITKVNNTNGAIHVALEKLLSGKKGGERQTNPTVIKVNC